MFVRYERFHKFLVNDTKWSPSLIHVFHWASTVLCCSRHLYESVFTWVAPSRQVLFTAEVPVFVLLQENSKLAFCNNFLMELISLPTNVNMTNPVLLLYMLKEMGCSCEVSGQWFFLLQGSVLQQLWMHYYALFAWLCSFILVYYCVQLDIYWVSTFNCLMQFFFFLSY